MRRGIGAINNGLSGTTDIDLNTQNFYIGRWISCTSDTFPTTHANLMTELEKLGQATTTLPTPNSIYDYAGGVPYSSKLIPLRNMDFLADGNNAILRSVSFYALDVTKSGSSHQHAATLSAILNPATTNDEYVRTKYLFNEISVTWQPTYFNPVFRVGGKNILANINSAETTGSATLGIGFGLPISFTDLYYRPDSGWTSFDVIGFCVQWIADTSRFQRYPIICDAEFVV